MVALTKRRGGFAKPARIFIAIKIYQIKAQATCFSHPEVIHVPHHPKLDPESINPLNN